MHKIKYLTHEEFDNLMVVLDKSKDRYAKRDKLIFLVAYECGLRATETSELKKKDYHGERKEMYCRRLKKSTNNTIRLTVKTNNLLRKYIDKHKESEYIFLSRKSTPLSRQHLTYLCKKYFKLADIPKDKRHFHTIKHTTGVHLADLGLDIKEVQFMLGHKDIRNTMIYFSFTTRQQETLFKKLGR